jgi:hypothetical protein
MRLQRFTKLRETIFERAHAEVPVLVDVLIDFTE